jgi:hypothetical protein
VYSTVVVPQVFCYFGLWYFFHFVSCSVVLVPGSLPVSYRYIGLFLHAVARTVYAVLHFLDFSLGFSLLQYACIFFP